MLAYQFIRCECRPSVWPYHDNPIQWPGFETYYMVVVHVIRDRLGPGKGSMWNSGSTWTIGIHSNENQSHDWWFRIQTVFSKVEKRPTLWRVLPAIEELQTAWEAKRGNPRFAVYQTAINDGLAKLNKYYSRFDEKPAYILALGMLISITSIWSFWHR